MADIRADDKLFSAAANVGSITTTETMVMLFKNPSGSGRTIKMRQVVLGNTHTVTSSIRFRMYAAPTITTNGTGLSEVALDIGSGNTASGQAFSSPTISANGTVLAEWIVSNGANGPSMVHTFPDGFQLRANQNILITGTADGTNRVAQVSLFWEED